MSLNNFQHKRDIFFDLDHTLWDFERNSALAFEQVIEEKKLPFSITEFLTYYVDINTAYWDKYSLNLVSQEELRIGRIRDTFENLKYKSTTEEMLAVGNLYLTYLPNNNHLIDGAMDVLNYLEGKYKMHIITNGFSQVQENKLANAQIAHFFETVTDSEVAGVKKPDQAIFKAALQLANAEADKSLMIGDNWIADVEGALSAGIDVVYFNEHHKELQKEVTQVNHLIELKNLL
ncbi:MAG: YjjG family noncanonical pyrimidine nucleotidase [Flavobacteriaceae bacterium]|jgi:putative hydrolase of the HAD superfamily|nr:YjjG family noncanonical pyrimidine nucleotidase [Flavobacteriaceae bacterium]